jgi:hypothetical protein
MILLSPRSTAGSVAIRHQTPTVYVDGAPRPDLCVSQWTILPGPRFGHATIEQRTPSFRQSPQDWCIGRQPPVGSAISFTLSDDQGGGQFTGVVTGQTIAIGQDTQRLAIHAAPALAVALAAPLATEFRLGDSGAVALSEPSINFNCEYDTWASEQPQTIGGGTARVFDSSAASSPWTVADALAYLLAAMPQSVAGPSLGDLQSLAGDIILEPTRLGGRSFADAICSVAAKGGLAVRAGQDGSTLEFYQPGRQGRPRTVCLQPELSLLSAGMTNMWQCEITFARRPANRGVTALGAVKMYEATFELGYGWDSSLQTDQWRDFLVSGGSEWLVRSDVFRLWVLNEDGRYDGAPWLLPAYDFTAIRPDDFTARRPRRFMPCLSTGPGGDSAGIVVEYYLPGRPWQRWTGPVQVARDQCAIYLGGDALPSDFFQAAIAGTLQVRVTATVQSDQRLSTTIDGDPSLPQQVIDCGDIAHWRTVDPSSVLAGQSIGQTLECDDSDILAALAQQAYESSAGTTEARIQTPRPDSSFALGDIVEQIDGRALDLSSNPNLSPHITTIEHDLSSSPCTHITVSG